MSFILYKKQKWNSLFSFRNYELPLKWELFSAYCTTKILAYFLLSLKNSCVCMHVYNISFMYSCTCWLEQFPLLSSCFFFFQDVWLAIIFSFFFFKAAQHKTFMHLLFTYKVACYNICQKAVFFLWCVLCLIAEVWPWQLGNVVKLQSCFSDVWMIWVRGVGGRLCTVKACHSLILNMYLQPLCLIFS